MTHSRVIVPALFLLISVDAANCFGATIDFESIASETLVRDQYLSLGVRVDGEGPNSGLVYSRGTHGIPVNSPGSGTQVMDIGPQGAPTRFWFVDQDDPAQLVGARRFRFIIAGPFDGWFRYRAFGLDGVPFRADEFSHQTPFYELSTPASQPFGSVELMSLNGASHRAIDDLRIKFVPEPSTTGLMIGCLLALCGGIGLHRFSKRLTHVPNVTKLVLAMFALIALSFARPAQARTVTLDFESIPSGTQLTDQYLADSVLGSPGNASSGLLHSKGTNGIPMDFPSSGTQMLYLGDGSSGLPGMRFDFVDPTNPDTLDPSAEVPVRRIRFIVGSTTDAPYRFDWLFGTVNNEFLHMGTLDATSPAMFDTDIQLGPFAGMPITALDLTSLMSGIVIDDVIIDFVPEPSAIGLAMMCLLVLLGSGQYRCKVAADEANVAAYLQFIRCPESLPTM